MIDKNYYWSIIAGLAVGTFLVRFAFVAVSNKIKITERQKEIFTFIPAAILPAIVAPMVFFHQGHVAWLYNKERFVILIIATLVSAYTKSMIATIVVGIALLYFVSNAIPASL